MYEKYRVENNVSIIHKKGKKIKGNVMFYFKKDIWKRT